MANWNDDVINGNCFDADAWNDMSTCIRNKPYDYLIFQASGINYALNGATGNIDSENVDAAIVFQYCVSQLSTGGLIFVKRGDYSVTHLDLVSSDRLTIEGEGYGTFIHFPAAGAVDKLIDFSDYSSYCKLKNLRLSANGRAGFIIYSFGKYSYLEVDGCFFTDLGNQIGLAMGRGAFLDFHDNMILANNANKVGKDCAAIYTDYMIIKNNIFYQNAGSGDLLTAAQMNSAVISGNVFRNTTGVVNSGMFLEVNLGNTNDIIISNNTLDKASLVVRSLHDNAKRAERIIIANNILRNGGDLDLRILTADGTDLGDIEDLIVSGNMLDSGDFLIQGMKDVKITDNFFGGAVTITAPNENLQWRNNEGYISENGGAAAGIVDGGTIAHGLAVTPTYVQLTPSIAGEMASATAIGAANITVAIKTHAGGAGTSQVIYWRAWI